MRYLNPIKRLEACANYGIYKKVGLNDKYIRFETVTLFKENFQLC